jgi:poly-gamma-glutamate capsule biosynthesis protein CapA/YwtB (metallophosphatase superfamily)
MIKGKQSVAEDNEILLYAVGDIAPSRSDPDSLFVDVRDIINDADLAFCQLEICITDRGERLPQVRHTDRTGPEAAHAIRCAGFDVVSFASNHCMDWGQDGLSDTIKALEDADLKVVGVGASISAAREPVIVGCKGKRIAFLAYSSILPMSYWAEVDRPGCAPMRAWTKYEPIEPDQPGTPCRVYTFPNEEDLAALTDDIRQAKERADLVFVSLHWGIHFIPAVIADYQVDVARAAIDAGADAILGHHAHILKGFESYKGKPVFYSLSNFAVDLHMDKAHAESKGFREIQKLHPDWQPDFDSSYNFPADSRRTVIAKFIIADGGLARVSLLPVYIDRQSRPEILGSSDSRFREVADYLSDITGSQGLNGRFEQHGDELVVETGESQQ